MNDKELLDYYERVKKEINSLEITLCIKKIALCLTEALLEIDLNKREEKNNA